MDESRVKALQPVFIVGTPKSGTSFLMSLFDSHPSVITLNETGVYCFSRKRLKSHREIRYLVDKFLAARYPSIHPILRRDAFLFKLRHYISSEGFSHLSRSVLYAFLEVILDGLDGSAAERITHFVEKTPTHYSYADLIFSDFPNAKVIHLLRDPRDNYLSLKRRIYDPTSAQYQRPGYHPVIFLRNRILSSLDAACKNVVRFGGQYRVLFYEDLIQGGEKMVRRLVSWLGLSWHEVLLIPSRNGELWRGNSFVPDLRERLKPFDTRPIGRWKTELSNREIRLMEYIIRVYNLQCKYPLTRDLTQWKVIWELMLPFQDELKLELKKLRRTKTLLWELAKLCWDYIERRTWIYSHLRIKSLISDNRLIKGSFNL